jgi:hypothetical protein
LNVLNILLRSRPGGFSGFVETADARQLSGKMTPQSKRKTNPEDSVSGLRLEFNFSAVPVGDDAMADHKAETGAGTNTFRGKEWLEDTPLDFKRNAASIPGAWAAFARSHPNVCVYE